MENKNLEEQSNNLELESEKTGIVTYMLSQWDSKGTKIKVEYNRLEKISLDSPNPTFVGKLIFLEDGIEENSHPFCDSLRYDHEIGLTRSLVLSAQRYDSANEAHQVIKEQFENCVGNCQKCYD